jgi:homoserine O-succinyltransferase/O-acetyltransferase
VQGERETYPTPPVGYFSHETTESLKRFQWKVTSNRTPEVMSEFPEALATANLQDGWHSSAVAVYRNWLGLIAEKKEEISCYRPMRMRTSVPYTAWTDPS